MSDVISGNITPEKIEEMKRRYEFTQKMDDVLELCMAMGVHNGITKFEERLEKLEKRVNSLCGGE